MQEEKKDFNHIVRVISTDIDGNKPIAHALLKIFGIGPEIGSLLYILPHGECQVSNPFVKGTWWDEDLVGISSIAPCTGKYAVGVQSCELYDVESWIDELPPRPQNPYCGTEREFPYTLRISVE